MKNRINLSLAIFVLGFASCSEPAPEQPTTADSTPEENVETEAVELSAEEQELYNVFLVNDSLLFQCGYDHGDSLAMDQMISEDFEFYHDKGGVTTSKSDFIVGMMSQQASPYEPKRKLVEGSMKVWPMHNGEDLYAAIQEGIHTFHEHSLESDEYYLTSTAKFSILWTLEDGKWKVTRALSYDHQVPE